LEAHIVEKEKPHNPKRSPERTPLLGREGSPHGVFSIILRPRGPTRDWGRFS